AGVRAVMAANKLSSLSAAVEKYGGKPIPKRTSAPASASVEDAEDIEFAF
ncbi:hypothetical protein KIPB_007165, partial [Kipferlia bialata]